MLAWRCAEQIAREFVLGVHSNRPGRHVQKKSAKAESSVAGWIAAAVIVVVAAAAGIYLAQKAAQPDVAHVATPSSPSNLPTSAATAPAPAIQHPIADAEPAPAPASTAALPALNDSDAGVRDDLLGLAGGDALRALLLPQQIIPAYRRHGRCATAAKHRQLHSAVAYAGGCHAGAEWQRHDDDWCG